MEGDNDLGDTYGPIDPHPSDGAWFLPPCLRSVNVVSCSQFLIQGPDVGTHFSTPLRCL